MNSELPRAKRFLEAIRKLLVGLYDMLYDYVLFYFKSVNHKIGSKLSVWYMKKETQEHLHLLTKVFKWIVLPASTIHLFAILFFFGKNILGSTLWGIAVFFYSQFLPDLPSIFRKKDSSRWDMPSYKKYALLLFTPLLVWLLFSDIRLDWKTTESFHNFKSLAVYGSFLLLCSFLAFGEIPIPISNITEIISIPLYGLTGYLTHLKVDKIW